MKIAIIGAGGRVGLPFSILSADAGHNVLGFDINKNTVDMLNNGIMPFEEEGASSLLKKYTKTNMFSRTKLHFTTDSILDYIDEKFDMFIYILGTPVDSEGNPVLDDLIKEFRVLKKYIDDNNKNDSDSYSPTIILRSTVAPGTTETLNKILKGTNTFPRFCGNYSLYYIPERVLQGKSLTETVQHDWIVGEPIMPETTTTPKIDVFMNSLGIQNQHRVSWKEAEIGKLMTNMWRYMNFAFANEMYMIGDHYDVDIHNVINSFNSNYPRLDVALPGPNVGGPCLFKDGKFLTQHIPFADLIDVSFQINEGMPEYVANKITQTPIENVLILGGTFKANCDDIRNSLSFKLVKCLKRRGITSYIRDPYFDYSKYILKTKGEIITEPEQYDSIVLMTPHDEYDNKYIEDLIEFGDNISDEVTFLDIWKKTDIAYTNPDGFWQRKK